MVNTQPCLLHSDRLAALENRVGINTEIIKRLDESNAKMEMRHDELLARQAMTCEKLTQIATDTSAMVEFIRTAAGVSRFSKNGLPVLLFIIAMAGVWTLIKSSLGFKS